MSQISKLYKFCFRKIFKKNWLRITLITLVLAVAWFAVPYLFYGNDKKLIAEQLRSGQFSDELDRIGFNAEDKEEILTDMGKAIEGFREWNRYMLEGEEKYRKFWRKSLKENVKKLEEERNKGVDEKKLKKIKDQIVNCELVEKRKLNYSFDAHFTTDNVFFFRQTESYWKGSSGWKLLNNISWWNLTGFVVLFWLTFSILDSAFFDSKKDGEEVAILLLTPGVKRDDLLLSKILAFLTFYSLFNIFAFLFPFGIYYFWVGTKTSMSAFSLLTLWTVIIGPILFFFLILAPYLLVKSWTKLLGWIFSSLVSFFPLLWAVGKSIVYPYATWPYKVEDKFFNLSFFIPISLILGIVALVLLYWQYQEEDLGQSL